MDHKDKNKDYKLVISDSYGLLPPMFFDDYQEAIRWVDMLRESSPASEHKLNFQSYEDYIKERNTL